MKLGDIKGESTDTGHKEWILLESMSSPIHRSIPSGAKDIQRTRGETMLVEVSVTRLLDNSSVKMQEACANGTFFKEVELHLCTIVKNKAEPYLKYKLSDVIIANYSFHGNASGQPLPSETVGMAYSKVEWTYIKVDPKTGDPKGNVVGKYEPGAHSS
jgi:type VI secretion system secreted protein Hcp